MGTVLLVLSVVLLLAGVAATVMAARLPLGRGSQQAVAERQRRLRFRLAAPAFVIGLLLLVVSRVV